MHVTSTEVHLVVSLAVAATAAGEKLDRISGNDRLIRVVTGRDLCKNHTNKAVIDRRLRPRCRHLGSYFKRPKSSPVRPLACNWYYCAQFIAKPKAACALRFSWAATSSNLELRANMTSSIKTEVHNI